MKEYFRTYAAAWMTLALASTAVAAPKYAERWNYVRGNLSSDTGLSAFLDVLKQSKDAGCTHILMADQRWMRMSDNAGYLARVARTKTFAAESHLTLIPGVFSLGYSGGYLGFDPNLCAGLPVKDMPFIVKGSLAEPDHALAVDVSGVKPDGDGMWGRIKLRPFTHYRVTFAAKAELTGDADEQFRITSNVGNRWLARRNLSSRREGGNILYETTFNSLEADEAKVRISGRIEDLKIDPAGLLMVIRRSLCPLKVVGADGTTYEEDKDFEPVADPKLHTDGEFTFTHEAPHLRVTADSRIKTGDKLNVSFFHAYRLGEDQDVISMEDPRVFEIMETDVRNCSKVWQPEGYMMNYDEIRIGGWETYGRKPGEILAAHVKKGCEIIRKHSPKAKIYTWSDMFTPYHNAMPFSVRGYYYLVNGNWDGSWEGLPRDVTILNWHAPKPIGLKFFSDRGHAQVICGYYDGGSTQNMKANITNWMKVSPGVPNIEGFMYTTWRNNYKDLKEYFQLLGTFGQWR